jgi:FlgD Ig-like domain
MTTNFNARSSEVQVSFRTGDRQVIADEPPPATLNPGPGPYTDRVRIGRRVLTGPSINLGIDTRLQAQDCFPTVQNSIVPGEHFSPAASDIFGTCAFSEGTELGATVHGLENFVTGDSITVENIVDARFVGGIAAVRWYGAITAGPHFGKGPAPYVAGGNGFFEVTPDSARFSTGQVFMGRWFVDFDDTYFRGGDQLKYFWTALDAAGGRSSAPFGINAGNFPPASVSAAEAATGGLFEFNALPTINWDPTYLAAIQADPHGDLNPTPSQIANSSQRACILYYQHVTSNRRSGEINRTSFMYTLDRLGFRGYYDVYDVQGYGSTNNQLGGRATVAQCTRYALIIEDDGRSNLVPNIPDGSDISSSKINQAQWYRDYLAQGLSGAAGIANLWILGENTAFEGRANPLFTTDLGLASIVNDQGLAVSPDVAGQTSFTFENGCVADFATDRFALQGGCPVPRAYDGASPGGMAIATHRYAAGSATGGGTIIMNRNTTQKWNTVWMGFGWFDVREAFGVGPSSKRPEEVLAEKILGCVLPEACVREPVPTAAPPPEVEAPVVTALHPNLPNPFNPVTTIRFDLSRDGWVELRIYDAAGKVVRTLVAALMQRGYGHSAVWDGKDATGRRTPSGVYFYRLAAGDFTATRKMVLLK